MPEPSVSVSASPSSKKGRRAVVRLALGLGGFVLHWMPVWIPLAVLAQISLRGLRPALAESRRLDACEAVVRERLAGHLARRAELGALHEALGDPIYRERLRLERSGE